jgi:thiol:disulfide interchange protein
MTPSPAESTQTILFEDQEMTMKRWILTAALGLTFLTPMASFAPALAVPAPAAMEARVSSIDWYTGPDEIAKVVDYAKQAHRPVLLYFHANWCPWCRKMERETFSDPDVERLADRFICIKIDTESEFGKKLVDRMGVNAFPEVRFYDRNGAYVKKVSGFKDADTFADLMRDVL